MNTGFQWGKKRLTGARVQLHVMTSLCKLLHPLSDLHTRIHFPNKYVVRSIWGGGGGREPKLAFNTWTRRDQSSAAMAHVNTDPSKWWPRPAPAN